MTIVKKAGKAIVVSCQLMFKTCSIIMIPTNTRIGDVAVAGINVSNGLKNVLSRNSSAHTTAVSPVRPPVAIPDMLSTPTIIGEQPIKAAIIVPIDTDIITSRAPLILPFSSNIPHLCPHPYMTPETSNNKTKKKDMTPTSMIEGEKPKSRRWVGFEKKGKSTNFVGQVSETQKKIIEVRDKLKRHALCTPLE